MKAFGKQVLIQLKMDMRDKGTFMVFYLVPLAFYLVVGAVFSSVNPLISETLSAVMAIFSITMGAVIGLPPTIVKMRETSVFRAYKINGIPNLAVMLSLGVSAFLHLSIVALIISISAPYIFDAQVPENILGYGLVMVVFLTCSVVIGLLIGVMAKSQGAALMLSQAVFMPSLMLSGIMFPATMLPEALMYAGYALPATHAMKGFTSLAYGIPTDIGSFTSLGIILGILILALGLTAYRVEKITRIN